MQLLTIDGLWNPDKKLMGSQGPMEPMLTEPLIRVDGYKSFKRKAHKVEKGAICVHGKGGKF